MQRRPFLQLLGMTAATASCPLAVRAGRGKRVVVIGAGLAGLSASYMLERLGYDVVLLEATQRVGGRVRTLDNIKGRPEGGANVLGPNYGRAIAYAKTLGVKLSPPPRPRGSGLLINSTYIPSSDWSESTKNILPSHLNHWMPDQARTLMLPKALVGSSDWLSADQQQWDYSALRFFQEQGLDAEVLDWFARNNSYGNSLEDTSLLNLMRVSESIQTAIAMRQPTLVVTGGNSRLPEAMANALKTKIVFGAAISEYEATGSEAIVRTRQGEEFRADAVLFAIPLTTLRDILFQPQLPSLVAELIARTHYHKVLQSHWTLNRDNNNAPPTVVWTNGPLGRLFFNRVDDYTVHVNAWINGNDVDYWRALRRQTQRQTLEKAMAKIPNASGVLQHDIDMDWVEEPYQKGVWASWLPGDIKHIHTLKHAQGRAFFAGEHTGASYSGMEGALESDERAVLQIDRALS